MKHLMLFEKFTEGFDTWFEGSKVADGNGNPIIVYHGTHYDFEVFNTRRGLSGTGYSMGSYFSDSIKEAHRYGKNVTPYYLSIKKIADFKFIDEDDSNGKEKAIDYLEKELGIMIPGRKSIIMSNPYFGYTTLESFDKSMDLVPKLKKRGFEGMAFNEGAGVTYVIFNKNQVKKVNI